MNETAPPSSSSRFVRPLAGIVIVSVVVIITLIFRDQFNISRLVDSEGQLREWVKTHPLLFSSGAFLVYVLTTGVSLPGAAVLSLVYGWLFGFLFALVLVSFASSIGATFAFLLSRYVFRDFVTKTLGSRAIGFRERLERDGPYYLFSLRLIPIVPFFAVNLAMGLTPLRTWTFYWVSQLGMLPGTIVYVYAGSTIPDLETLVNQGTGGLLKPEIVTAFVVLGLFPWLVKLVFDRLNSGDPMDSLSNDGGDST